jgi:K+-sensing histidine kinase KdpD
VSAIVADAAAAYATRRASAFSVDAPAGLVAMADARLVSRVLSNLIGNAVDALPSGGRIRVAAGREDGRIGVVVEGRRAGRRAGDPSAPLRPVLLREERRHGARPRDRE